MRAAILRRAAIFITAFSIALGAHAQKPLHVLAFYSTDVELDHVTFAQQAIGFFTDTAQRDHFDFVATSNWDDLNLDRLKDVQLVLWLNEFPHTTAQRMAFEQYMRNGGGWLGFHVSAYNDADTHWPWLVDFLGGTVFSANSWPPLPAVLDIDDKTSPIARRLPAHLASPANEWYTWQPSPRANTDIKVLLTLDPANYPLGLKDTITHGDLPVVWSNTKYRMIYMNMGHGDKIFTSPDQNHLFENATLWLLRQSK
jgi:type 1 glutamine amidotransferase